MCYLLYSISLPTIIPVLHFSYDVYEMTGEQIHENVYNSYY